MSEYNTYPAVDKNYNFPTKIREALAKSAEFLKLAWAPQRNVPADADMNTFRDLGIHRITTPDTRSITNLPVGMNQAGIFENLQTGDSKSDWWIQRITTHGLNPRMYYRSTRDLSGTWNDWELVSTDGGVVTELHVFLAVGQSNMSGRAPVSSTWDIPNRRIFEYGAKTSPSPFSRSIKVASVPLNMHDEASGLSPATIFARNYLKSQPDNVGVLIVPAAHGGTGFTSSTTALTWTPNKAASASNDLPALAVKQTKDALAAAKSGGYNVRFEGILWHQGENNSSMSYVDYTENLHNLIKYFRSQFNRPTLPFIVGQMVPEGIEATTGRSNIDAAHKDIPERVDYTAFAEATRGGHNSGDTTHMSRVGVEYLGHSYLTAFKSAQANGDILPRLAKAETSLSTLPEQVTRVVAENPEVVAAAARLAVSDAGLLSKWKPNTNYLTGESVISPLDGDIITRVSDGTGGATFTMTGWKPSTLSASLSDKLSAASRGSDNGVASLDNSGKVPVSEIPDAVKTKNGTRPVGEGEIFINVLDYGAKGNWTSGSNGVDNLGPFTAAWAEAVRTGRSLYIPDGKYRFSGEWDVYRKSGQSPMTIVGESRDGTWLVSDFYGADKALVKNFDPNFVDRAAPLSYHNLQFRSTSRTLGVNPVYMHNGGWGESVMDHIKFGPSNNTHFRGASLQNIRAMDTVSYYGGRNFLYKSTDGMTFTVALPGTITASADIFTQADIGELFFVVPSNDDQRIMYKIATVIDAKRATIDTTETPVIAAVNPSKGNFDAARATMDANSNRLKANAPCFVANDVGRVLVIQNARQGAYGTALLRASIVKYISPTEVELSLYSDLKITKQPFAMPVFDISSDKSGATLLRASSTDIKWTNLHIEAYTGLGLSIIDGLQWHINDQKIHGEHDPVDTRMSTGMAWFDCLGGVFSGEFDGQSHSVARLYFCNMNDTVEIPFLSTRRVRNEKLFMVEDWTANGGFVSMGTLIVYRQDDRGPEIFVVDRGAAAGRGNKFVYTSTVTMVGGGVMPRVYSGMNTYFTPDGRMIRRAGASTGYDMELATDSGARVLLEDIGTKKWSVGNPSGGGTGFVITDETLSLIRLLISGTTGAVTPGSNNTQALGALASRWSDVFATKITVGSTGITSSSGNGSPEGVLAAPVGSEYINVNGADGAIKWFKASGTGNTGWVAKW